MNPEVGIVELCVMVYGLGDLGPDGTDVVRKWRVKFGVAVSVVAAFSSNMAIISRARRPPGTAGTGRAGISADALGSVDALM